MQQNDCSCQSCGSTSPAWFCVAKVINRKDVCQALVRPWERVSGRASISHIGARIVDAPMIIHHLSLDSASMFLAPAIAAANFQIKWLMLATVPRVVAIIAHLCYTLQLLLVLRLM